MIYRQILEAAVSMLCESDENGNTEDYEERASHLLAIFATQCVPLDQLYRKALGKPAINFTGATYVDLDTAFPLSNIFAAAATYYLAAMLVIEDNEEMSDTLYAKYTNLLATIQSSLPASLGGIVNYYPTL